MASTNDPFYRLPLELSDMILIELTGPDWTLSPNHSWHARDPKVVSRLKNLRLTSKRLAYYEPLLRLAFHTIYLTASNDHVARLKSLNSQAITPHIQKVVFRAQHSEWCFNFRDWVCFRAMVDRLRTPDSTSTPPEWFDSELSKIVLNTCQTIETHILPSTEKKPWNEWEIALSWLNYRRDIQQDPSLITNGRLQDAWTGVLETLKKPIAIEFDCSSSARAYSFSDLLKNDFPDPATTLMESIRHNKESDGQNETFTVDGAVFQAGIQSLAQAKMCPISLRLDPSIEFLQGPWLDWEKMPGWSDLDLNNLRELDFQPIVTRTADPNHQHIGVESATCALLRKCRSNLRCMYYSPKNEDPVEWPGEEVFQLPNLQSLCISITLISPPELANWIEHMPSLLELELNNVVYSDLWVDHYAYMKDVWKVLRDRPLLRLVWREGSKRCFDTMELRREPNPENLSGVACHLALYLNRKIEW